MIWDQLTSVELSSIDKKTPVVLVISATEQHGAHLPLATDRIIGEYFALELHRSDPNKVLVLPVVSIGCSDHHMDFSGTLSLNHDHFRAQICDIVTSVIIHGFTRIILLNSHGGNQAVGQIIIEQLGARYPNAHFVLATWWRIASEELQTIRETPFGGIGHGCEFETSLIMHISPDLVREKEIKSGCNTPTYSWAESDMLRAPKASYYRSMKGMTANGVFGDPAAATAGKGKKIVESVLTMLKKIVDDLQQIP